MRFPALDLAANPARGMKIIATSMIVVMACIFLAASAWRDAYPWLGYVRAFAEASMVGGLADWFAVTALFRHPLGLPIPHTAIIPRNKDRIGAALATFLKSNFLTPRIVARRLEQFDMAGAAGRWLVAPGRSGQSGHSVARLASQTVEALDSDAIGGLVKQAAASRLRALEVSPLLGAGLDAAIEDGRHEPLINAVMVWASRALNANEHMIRDAVAERTTWLLRVANLDDSIANRIIDAIRALMDEVAGDPYHPLRRRVTLALQDLAFDFRHMPETRVKVEKLKNELLDHPEVGKYLAGLWGSIKGGLLTAANDPDDALSGKLGDAARQLGETLQRDERLRRALNLYARRAIVGIVTEYGDEIVRLVSDTVKGWDAHTVTDRVENAVGRDLQYIRINGTLIGGLVGLLIYTASELL